MSRRRSRPGRTPRRALANLVAVSLLVGLFLVVAGGSALVRVLSELSQGLPDVSRLRSYEPSETTRIYASDGRLIATLFKENRTWTPLDEISPHLKNAVLAIEDSRFYRHRGVDPVGVVRAALDLLRTRRIHQGASTITMQLARNLFLSPEQSFRRKLREALLAIQIEKKFTKDEILELYLNQIYFGAGAHGVEAAANVYFNKKAKDLTIPEAAVIAGLPAAPSEYSPLVNPEAARQRQIQVLGRMVHLGYLSWPEYRRAMREGAKLKYANQGREEFTVLEVPYFTTYVLKELYSRYGEDLLYRGGLKIYTTVDLKLQRRAEEILRRQIQEKQAAGWGVSNGALVCIENRTGYIRAMVGGLGWSRDNQFNRAWQARRQPGSSFKVFVYTTAIEAGYTPDTVVPDTPVTYKIGPKDTWSPRNSDRRYLGAIPLRTALQYSRNVVAVKLLTMVGPERVIDYAYRMGIKEKLQPHLSLALGSAVVTPLEMAAAFSVLANGGIRIDPTPIKIIYDSEGNVVEDHTFPRKVEVLSESTAFTMTEMLRRVVEAGTGTRARLSDRPAAGKTGTTDDFRDAWFCGYTPQYTAAVWVGNDDYRPMNRVYGGDLPAPIWQQFMTFAHRGKPVMAFGSRKGGNVSVLMCSETHKRANARCVSTYRAYYPPSRIPRVFCHKHGRPARVLLAQGAGKEKAEKEKPRGEPPVEEIETDIPAEAPTPIPMDLPVEIPVEPPADIPPVETPPVPEALPLPVIPSSPAPPRDLPSLPEPTPQALPRVEEEL